MTKQEIGVRILDEIRKMESQIASIPDPAERARFEGLISRTKREVAPSIGKLEGAPAYMRSPKTASPVPQEGERSWGQAIDEEGGAVLSSAFNAVPFVRPMLENVNELGNELARGNQTARDVINTVLPQKGSHQRYMSKSKMPTLTGSIGLAAGTAATVPFQLARAATLPLTVGGVRAAASSPSLLSRAGGKAANLISKVTGRPPLPSPTVALGAGEAIGAAPFAVLNKVGEGVMNLTNKVMGKYMPASPHVATVVGNTLAGAATPAIEIAISEGRAPTVEETAMGGLFGLLGGTASALHGKAIDPRTTEGRIAAEYETNSTVKQPGEDKPVYKDPEFIRQGDSEIQSEDIAGIKKGLSEEAEAIKSEMSPQIDPLTTEGGIAAEYETNSTVKQPGKGNPVYAEYGTNYTVEQPGKGNPVYKDPEFIRQGDSDIQSGDIAGIKKNLSEELESIKSEMSPQIEATKKAEAERLQVAKDRSSDIQTVRARRLAEIKKSREAKAKEEAAKVEAEAIAETGRAAEAGVGKIKEIESGANKAAEDAYQGALETVRSNPEKYAAEIPVPDKIVKMLNDARRGSISTGKPIDPQASATANQIEATLIKDPKKDKNGTLIGGTTTPVDLMDMFFKVRDSDKTEWGRFKQPIQEAMHDAIPELRDASKSMKSTRSSLERELDILSGKSTREVGDRASVETSIGKKLANIGEGTAQETFSPSQLAEVESGRFGDVVKSAKSAKEQERAKIDAAKKKAEESIASTVGRVQRVEDRTRRHYQNMERGRKAEAESKVDRLSATMEERLSAAKESAKSRIAEKEKIRRQKEVQEKSSLRMPRVARSNLLNEGLTAVHQLGQVVRSRTARYLDDYSKATPMASRQAIGDDSESAAEEMVKIGKSAYEIPASVAKKYDTIVKSLSGRSDEEIKKIVEGFVEKTGSIEAGLQVLQEKLQEQGQR